MDLLQSTDPVTEERCEIAVVAGVILDNEEHASIDSQAAGRLYEPADAVRMAMIRLRTIPVVEHPENHHAPRSIDPELEHMAVICSHFRRVRRENVQAIAVREPQLRLV